MFLYGFQPIRALEDTTVEIQFIKFKSKLQFTEIQRYDMFIKRQDPEYKSQFYLEEQSSSKSGKGFVVSSKH